VHIVREMHYQKIRDRFTEAAYRILRQSKMDDLRPLKPGELETTRNSHTAWRLLRELQMLDVAYGQNDLEGTCAALDKVRKLARVPGDD
jgi:hypothetical protein